MWGWLKRIIDYPRLESENTILRADLRLNSEQLKKLNNIIAQTAAPGTLQYSLDADNLTRLTSKIAELEAENVQLRSDLKANSERLVRLNNHLAPIIREYTSPEPPPAEKFTPFNEAQTKPFVDQLGMLWLDIRKEVEEKKE